MNQSFEQICKSPLNKSTAKQLYSFPKAKRFVEQLDETCPSIYTLPSTRSKRAAGIGYGRKVQMTSTSITPGPNQYAIKSEMSDRLDKLKGWTLSVGRDKSNKYEGIFLGLVQKTPGPGTYDFKQTLSSIKYSIRKRTESYNTKELRPGPGQYNIPLSLNESGKYKISQFRDSGAIIFSPRKPNSERLKSPLKLQTPGPGAYKHAGNLDPLGLYYCSKYSDSKATTFTKAKRKLESSRNESPGPGEYRLPSEFGHYEK